MAVVIKKNEVVLPRITNGKHTEWFKYWGKRASFTEPILRRERVKVTLEDGTVFIGVICGLDSSGGISVMTAAKKKWENIDCTKNVVEVLNIVEHEPTTPTPRW